MALSDLMLKTKINMALARDPRVGVFDIGVHVSDGRVILTGDVDDQTECDAASQITRQVPGVVDVKSDLTCGVGKRSDTAELVGEQFLEKLDSTWHELPDQSALSQADYLRWALWMVYKFKLPENVIGEGQKDVEADITEQALSRIAGYIGAPKALIGLHLITMAEMADRLPPAEAAPDLENAPLVATPIVDEQAA